VEELGDVKINVAYIGTCTNGRLEDLETAAKILKGRSIHPDVEAIVAPASREIYLEAARKGFIKALVEAGCVVVGPGCGPCVGTHNGVLADNGVAISTANRNFTNRMGIGGKIYLSSVATAAASALAGVLTNPEGLP